jgi:uncharacterized protein YndB with AHSA1/START domain
MSTITGYKQDTQGAYIEKDPSAQLVYTMDWSQWLSPGQSITAVTYTENSRINDTAPLVIESDGIVSGNKKTYAEISGGAVNKVYTVTAHITCDDGAEDSRYFRIKIENRSL